jgi:parallel beta helix pectate lyase-like protein
MTKNKIGIQQIIVLVIVNVLLTSLSQSFGMDLYIATNGNDSNPGSVTEPFASLQAARDAIRNIKQKDGLPSEGVTIWLREGTYSLTKSFELLERDSGNEKSPIIYRAYKDEKVRLIGGRSINSSAFKPVTDPAILKRFIDDRVRSKIFQVNLKTLGIKDYGKHAQYGHSLPVVPAPLELFFNNKVMSLAHYPNTDAVLIGKIIDKGSTPRWGDYSEIGGKFEYTDLRHSRWAESKDVWLHGTFNYGYADDKIKIASIDTKNRQIKLSSPHMYGINSGKLFQKYVAVNILEELDMPEEWYVDRKTGILYFWPPEDITNAQIEVSMLKDLMVVMENVSYTTLRNLTLEITRGIGIYIEGGQNNLVASCTVRNIGTNGIFMGQGAKQTFPHITHDDYEGEPMSRQIGNLQGHIYEYTTWDRKAGKNHGITGCDVYSTGSGGIYLSGGSKKELIRGNCYVTNCRISDYNRRNKFLWAGINVDGCGNKVTNNEIFNSDFQGIYVHGNEHLFEYNHIHHVALDSDDTSAWYLGRDPSDRGNLIRYNFFHHVGRPDRMVMGIYFDDATCGVTVFGNVFYKVATHGTVFSNAGHDITVKNNIVIESYGPAVWLNSMWYNFGADHLKHFFGKKGLFQHRLKDLLDIKKPPYSTTYPKLVDWLDTMKDGKTFVGMRPRRNLMKNNVIVNCPKTLDMNGEYAQFEQDNNFETKSNPGFVDAEHLNFQLKQDSIVYKKIPEFQEIPFKKIGLYKNEYRKKL